MPFKIYKIYSINFVKKRFIPSKIIVKKRRYFFFKLSKSNIKTNYVKLIKKLCCYVLPFPGQKLFPRKSIPGQVFQCIDLLNLYLFFLDGKFIFYEQDTYTYTHACSNKSPHHVFVSCLHGPFSCRIRHNKCLTHTVQTQTTPPHITTLRLTLQQKKNEKLLFSRHVLLISNCTFENILNIT